MGYGHGVIRRKRDLNLKRGPREYVGPCEAGCGRVVHTYGDPPRKTCLACLAKERLGQAARDGGRP
ncbi:MAG: hypothetical protein C4551_06250 [Bacillota bacterium]|nr:MAG: hypothetical protein C4551_06250 [Bacillota bacterium]